MNELGQIAMNHWKQWRPEEYQQIPDPETHFAQMGEAAQEQLLQIEEQIVRDGTASQDYLEEVGRRNTARQTAREIVLADLLPPPESPEGDSPDPEPPTYPEMDSTGMPLDPEHPLWLDLEDDSVSPAEFHRRWETWRDSLRSR